jgi:PKD repeat protein
LQAPSDLRLNASNGIISWTVPDSFTNRALTIGAVAENSSGSSRSIWWTVTFHSSCTLTVTKPKPPTFQDSGVINKNIYFNVDSTDQKLKLQYRFHWGDSTISNWSTLLSAMHSYTKPGTYYVRLQTATIDTSAVSELSEPRMISIGIQNTTPTIQQRVIFSADTISTGQNLSISLANGSSDSFFTYIRFNDTLKTILTDTLPVSHSWNKPGDYPVFVISINRYLPDTLTDTCIIHVIATNKADTAFPVITLIGTSDTTLSVNTVYQDPGATAMDDTDGDISQLIKVSTDLDASKPGTYYFSYTVEDAAGNTTTVKRKVVIE